MSTPPSQHPADTARPAVTPAEIVIIVVVGLLVLVFGYLLINRLSPGDDPAAAPNTPAATEGTTEATPENTAGESESPAPESSPSEEETTEEADEPETFQTPSQNIVCVIDSDGASCLIRSFDYTPEDAQSCAEDAGGHLRVTADGASMPCDPLVISGGPSTLDYGESVEAFGFSCLSAEDGVTCSNSDDQGFQVARAAYRLF